MFIWDECNGQMDTNKQTLEQPYIYFVGLDFGLVFICGTWREWLSKQKTKIIFRHSALNSLNSAHFICCFYSKALCICKNKTRLNLLDGKLNRFFLKDFVVRDQLTNDFLFNSTTWWNCICTNVQTIIKAKAIGWNVE